MSSSVQQPATSGRRLRFDRFEWAGALGDVGTFIPFLVAYTAVAKLPALGILFSFGVALIACGLYYRTPFPVQPMKASGAVIATQGASLALTVQSVYCATLLTGAFWLLLALTGLAQRIAALVHRPVAAGIILGLGVGFILQGGRMMLDDWLIGVATLIAALLLSRYRRVPTMFILLLFGGAVALWQDAGLYEELRALRPALQWPTWALDAPTWRDWSTAFLFLVLPQLPLTLGNAIIGIKTENNRLFPDRRVSAQEVSLSTGIMNLAGGVVGAVPMCHGAGGMAAQVRFGARTGGAPVIFGVVLLLLALFFSDSVDVLLQLFPLPVLGVVLALAGVELARGALDFGTAKGARFVALGTAAIAIWNVGVAFLFGLMAYELVRRQWLRGTGG